MRTQTVYITIGRNVGNGPMSPDRWRLFRSDVREAIRGTFGNGAPMVLEADGKGWWDGMTEDAHIFAIVVPNLSATERAHFLRDIARIGRSYDQDAVAVAFADVSLV